MRFRVLSLANGVVGVMRAASLGIHAIGPGLADAQDLDPKHAIKQVDRLLSNQQSRNRDLDVVRAGGRLRRRGSQIATSSWSRWTGPSSTRTVRRPSRSMP
jgi:hypothetical protein